MKKCLVYVALFISFCFLGNLAVNSAIASQMAKRSPYSLSFACIGAICLESRLDCRAKIKSDSSSRDLSEYLNKILRTLDLPIDYRQVTFNQATNSLNLQYKISQQNTKYAFDLSVNKQEKSTLISVTIVNPGSELNLLEVQKDLDEVPGVRWQHYHYYQGVLREPVTYPSQLVLLQAVAKTLQAQNTCIYRDGQQTCITAYSPLLNSEAVATRDKKYNFQVALRGNEGERKNFFYIGSPLLVDK